MDLEISAGDITREADVDALAAAVTVLGGAQIPRAEHAAATQSDARVPQKRVQIVPLKRAGRPQLDGGATLSLC